jgi:hypothetical protein
MSAVATPIFLALEVATPLDECAVNMLVLIPASDMIVFNHFPMVQGLTAK